MVARGCPVCGGFYGGNRCTKCGSEFDAPTPPATAFEAAVDRLSSAIDVCAYYEGRDDLRAAVDEARSALLAAHAAAIAKAVAEERERCAKVAENNHLDDGECCYGDPNYHRGRLHECEAVAAAIRGGE